MTQDNYTIGYDPYKKEGYIGSAYIYKRGGDSLEVMQPLLDVDSEMRNGPYKDIPFIDPYYYQYYVEERVKLIEQVKDSYFWKWDINPYISNQEIKGWIEQGREAVMRLIWGKI